MLCSAALYNQPHGRSRRQTNTPCLSPLPLSNLKKTMNNSTAPTPSLADASIEIEVVVKALEQVPHPVTVKQLRDRLTGPYKLPTERLEKLLEEHSATGRIHRFAPLGRSKQSRYWTQSLEGFARAETLHLIGRRPQTQAELLRKLKPKLAGYSEQQQKSVLAQMIKEKQIQLLPPFIGSRSTRYAMRAADPIDYLEDALAKLSKKLGLSREDLVAAARLLPLAPAKTSAAGQNDLSEKVLARMLQVKLAAAQGGLVPLPELWRSLQNEGWDKASFDRTVLNLAESYRVSLHRHNFPASLSQEERAELVADGLGNYYIGIALR